VIPSRLLFKTAPALLGVLLLLPACSDDAGGGEGDETGGPVSDVPTEAVPLQSFLDGGNYSDFAAESAVHGSTNGSPHGNVRVFLNDTLDGSLANGNETHPIGSAAVKELYDADEVTLIGWAVSVKIADESEGGNGWYWYEYLNDEVVADEVGAGTCIGCHFASGTDMVAVNYPLE